MAFVSSLSSTNEVNTAYEVSTANTQVSPVSTQISTASTQKTGRKITINGIDTAGYDKSKTINMEETSSKAMLAIDGAGFDWSYMADDEVPTNMALMAFSDSEFNKSEFNLATYKRGLASVEEQLVFYKKNELEKIKQQKESIQLKIENFDYASKSLDKLIGSHITDNSRKEEFQQPEFEGYGPKTSKSVSEDISNEVRESPDASLVEELVSNDKPKAVNNARPNTAVVNAVRANQVNAVKASACWVWRPIKLNSASITFKRHNYVDARGRSKSVMAWVPKGN
ncbi:hypothetical protein Tco_0719061 [Tanacetum coccineum]